ncbi:MAG: DUF362 domain-containing protein [Chloroflexota bacterium]|nr:DUF362 domain-containing protein [Chloroflexota bacterium]
MGKHRVALIRGDNRYANVSRALQAIESDIDLAGKRRVVVKPNFVSVRRSLAATHPDAVRAVLDFLQQKGVRKVTLAEGPAMGSFRRGLKNHNYSPLLEDYDLDIVDLNKDETVDVGLYTRSMQPMRLPVARTTVESDYRISVGPPKTHDIAIVTLSLKNMAFGSLTGRKSRAHQGHKGIHMNLYKLAYHVAPQLAVIDGFRAMEGNGPVGGSPVDWRMAVASTDFVAADSLTAQLMGFDMEDVGYIYYCSLKGLGHGERAAMEIVGNARFEEVQRDFKPHRTYERQLHWHIPDFEQYL